MRFGSQPRQSPLLKMNPFDLINNCSLSPPRSLIQIGASSGQEVAQFAARGIKNGIFIEPLPFAYEHLSKVCSHYEGFLCVNQLVGRLDFQEHTFHIANNGGESSSILLPKNHKVKFPHVDFLGEVKMQCISLDTLVSWVGHNHPSMPANFDLIYIDVQGAELEVFKGASKTLQSTKYVFSEIGFGGGYENDVSYLNLMHFLDSFGFKVISLNIDPRSGYGDALFVNLANCSLG